MNFVHNLWYIQNLNYWWWFRCFSSGDVLVRVKVHILHWRQRKCGNALTFSHPKTEITSARCLSAQSLQNQTHQSITWYLSGKNLLHTNKLSNILETTLRYRVVFLPVQKVFLPGRAAKSGKNLAKMVITGKNWQKVFLVFYSENILLYRYNIIRTLKMKLFLFSVGHLLVIF